MPEIIKPGDPAAQFPIGHVFNCKNCGCQFKAIKGDAYDLVTFEGSTDVTKSVTVECPNCFADVTERRIYSVQSEPAQIGVEVHLANPRPSAFRRPG